MWGNVWDSVSLGRWDWPTGLLRCYLQAIEWLKARFLRSAIPGFLVCLWTSLVAQMVKASAYNVGDPGSISGSGRSPWRKKWQPILVLLPGKSHGRTEEPGRLQSMGLQRVGHDWATSLSLSPILVHFSSLISKMLMFTLAISCLTTSNLPWFTDLTF